MTLIYKRCILLILVLGIAIAGCKKHNEEPTPVGDRFQVVDSKSTVNGNMVDGIALTKANTFTLAYLNAGSGTSATISAEAVNGLSIAPTQVTLTNSATVDVPITGTPASDGTFSLAVKIDIGGTVYLCTKIFNVDLPNITTITSTLPETDLFNVNVVTSINFDIYPRTTVLTFTAPANLTVEIISTSAKGRTLKLTPTSQFVSGTVVVTANFMALPPLVKTIKVTAFSKGDGSAAAPFEITDAERLGRLPYGLSSSYKLINDITTTSAAGTVVFAGTLDGNGKKISGVTINSATTDNVGYFGEIATTGTVKNLILDNLNVTGQNNIGAVAGINRGTITNVTVNGSISGGTAVGGIAGNNFGSIASCDVTALNVSGINNIASLTPNVNSGSTQTGNVILVVPATFPTTVYGVSSAQNVDFSFAPSDGTVAAKTVPANLTASPVSGQQKLTLTPLTGFISGDLQVSLQKGKLTALRTVKIFSKTQGSIFDAGDGSVGSPYLISTAAALDAIRNDGTKNYKIVTDITWSGQWTPIPTFSGSIDGQNFKVSNISITSTTANEGWISTSTGTIKNIRFLNVNCNTSAAFGVVAGKNNGGLIQNVLVGGSVTSTNTGDVLGGIVGELASGGKVTQCYTNLAIVASCGMVGGLVGRLTTAAGPTAEISFSTATGTIEENASKNRIAGILGRAEGTVVGGGIIKNCLATVAITATGINAVNVNGVGGIFGADQNAGIVPIDQCMFTGTISAGFSIGGIAGVGSNITNCIVIGQGFASFNPTLRSMGTPATGNIGGIAGTNKVKLVNCVVKNATLKAAATTNLMPVAGMVSTYQNGGYTSNSFITTTSLEGSTTPPNGDYVFRIAGTAGNSPGVNGGNYATASVTAALRSTAMGNDPAGLDGGTTAVTTQTFFQSTMGFDYSIWKTDTDGFPTLQRVGYNGGSPTP
ncbi:beta strand repeat-containing protein [Mucilaginibacter sp. AW1-3]